MNQGLPELIKKRHYNQPTWIKNQQANLIYSQEKFGWSLFWQQD